jgi:hypothetical protein
VVGVWTQSSARPRGEHKPDHWGVPTDVSMKQNAVRRQQEMTIGPG